MCDLKREYYDDENTIKSLSDTIKPILNENTVIVCIGTDKVIGDSLGPIIGTMLKNSGCKFPVYGTLKQPVHALNIYETINIINKKYPNATILSIDACLGKSKGSISIRDEAISPGKGAGKKLPDIGDHSIVGIVDTPGNINGILKDTRLSFILEMAEVIATSIIISINDEEDDL